MSSKALLFTFSPLLLVFSFCRSVPIDDVRDAMDRSVSANIADVAVGNFPMTADITRTRRSLPSDDVPDFGSGEDPLLTGLAPSHDSSEDSEVTRDNRWERNIDDDIVRMRQLYCRAGGHHLQILPDGSIRGTRHSGDQYAALEMAPVHFRGVMRIKGYATGLHLCMDARGRLYGSSVFTEECKFRETLEENLYNTYYSVLYGTRRKRWYVALNKQGRPRNALRTKRKHLSTHFLPRRV
ncbi:fibroblast growth factor 16-like [Branchiostoma floridae]|uniref:Fibroblast growth factor n=2 Tax=Branchiostoma floridae TaxID=7739 RepID=A0A9J7MP55_BRAFL|nr:fibroblast growth factor 16-like [Branchiostoma floridae]